MDLITINSYVKVFPDDRKRIKKKKKPNEEQTIVANVSNDMSHYYSNFLFKEYGLLLEPPPFGSHVTINNGIELIQDLELHMPYLKELNGKKIKIQYEPIIKRHWEFFVVKVYSDDFNEIRKRLGLSVKESFHITIGKLHPECKKQNVLTRVIP